MGRAGEAPRCAPRLRRQSAALRERPAALSATILRVGASLDLDTVLAEGERFEQALQRLRAGLSKPRTTRRLEKVWQRIGRLKQKYPPASPHYQIEVRADAKGAEAVGLSSQRQAALDGDTSGGVLPAHQLGGLGHAAAVEHVRAVDGSGSSVPLAEERVGAAPDLPGDLRRAGRVGHAGRGEHQRQQENQHRHLAAPKTSQAGDFGRARIQRRVWARWIPYPNSRVGA